MASWDDGCVGIGLPPFHPSSLGPPIKDVHIFGPLLSLSHSRNLHVLVTFRQPPTPLLRDITYGWSLSNLACACLLQDGVMHCPTDECEPKGLLALSPLCRGGNFSGASYIEKSEHESGRNADGEGRRGKGRPFGCTGEVAWTCLAHANFFLQHPG